MGGFRFDCDKLKFYGIIIGVRIFWVELKRIFLIFKDCKFCFDNLIMVNGILEIDILRWVWCYVIMVWWFYYEFFFLIFEVIFWIYEEKSFF